jgi:signal transduction histidine kinase/CheY-like chemotaxis protein
LNVLLTYLQNLDAIAFLLLGVTTTAAWIRRRDGSLGFLAMAIVLLSLVAAAGRIPVLLHFTPPLLNEISLVAFVGSGYALLRFRGSLIPFSRRWHLAALVSMAAAVCAYLIARQAAAQDWAPPSLVTWVAIALILVWSATVVEPIVRFWLVARTLPAVQAWRLRTLSLGFAGIVAILLFAVGAGALASNPSVQVAIELLVLVVVPLLYVSFSPPAWLRRQWRATEEEGLRAFMEDLVVLDEEIDALSKRALDWAMRLVGGAAAVSFYGDGKLQTSRGLTPHHIAALQERLPVLAQGMSQVALDGWSRNLIVLPFATQSGAGRLVVLSGAFTPGFGGDELNRVQQFISAVATALDRARLVVELKEANRQLKEANQHKSVFLANMSHELRTPLNAIIGFAELIIDSREGEFDTATQKRFLNQIHSSGKHLLGLINDILDLSKVEAGQMELRLQMVPIGPAVAEVLATVEPLAGQKQIRLESKVDGAGEVLADAAKLKQMLLNLVANAIKFTPDEGTVRIEALRLASSIEISVVDTGIGISESDQTRIFQEFQQLDVGPGRRQPGTGLGLALTRRFARLHGGDVRVHSDQDKGSVFTLSLPLRTTVTTPAAAHTGSAPEASIDSSRPLVLVIEDDPPAAELLRQHLHDAGFQTEVARSGTEAIAKASTLQPAAITLDILLPELDGWEVMTRLKQDEATSHIPIVVVSVVDNPELGMALGALDYFVKPVDGKELVRRLSRFNFRRSPERPEFRVLVADDEAANRSWLARILEPAGFAVIEAAGGREAIELAQSHRPDLVLLDLMMPEVSGFDVVEALRANPATEKTPIMVLTARRLTAADKRHLNGHVSTFLSRASLGSADLVNHLRYLIEPRNASP